MVAARDYSFWNFGIKKKVKNRERTLGPWNRLINCTVSFRFAYGHSYVNIVLYILLLNYIRIFLYSFSLLLFICVCVYFFFFFFGKSVFAAIRRGGLLYATGVSRRIIFTEDRRLKNSRCVISARETTVLPTILSLSSARNRNSGCSHAPRNLRGDTAVNPRAFSILAVFA